MPINISGAVAGDTNLVMTLEGCESLRRRATRWARKGTVLGRWREKSKEGWR
jgi:hypothetical protein